MRGFLILILLLPFYLSAQNKAVMVFQRTVNDFGTIREADGKVEYDFVFVNKGKIPVIIKNVKSSCGCTAPQWTKRPILPGKSGYIKAVFSPDNRPGNFDKTLTVYSNAERSVRVLRIKGKVIPIKRTVLDDYPYELPSGLRLYYDCLLVGQLNENEVKKVEIPVYNNDDDVIKMNFENVPLGVKVYGKPAVLASKAKGVIVAEYDAGKTDVPGRVDKQLILNTGRMKHEINLSADIRQDFSGLSALQRANAPHISLAKRFITLNNVAAGKDVGFSVDISNKGKTDLLIRRVYAIRGNIVFDADNVRIKAGKSHEIKGVWKLDSSQGKQRGVAEIISNDPDNSEIKLRLTADVR